MSTFAVFGMTWSAALDEARKKTSTNKTEGGRLVEMSLSEWTEKVETRAEKIMTGKRVVRLSPLFDAPQFARQFIELAGKGRCRALEIRARTHLVDAAGRPIINPKTKVQKIGFVAWQEGAA